MAAIVIFAHKDMPKRRTSAFYSQLAKRRFASVDSMHSHVDSPRVSVDTSLSMESSGSNSSGAYLGNSLKLVLY